LETKSCVVEYKGIAFFVIIYSFSWTCHSDPEIYDIFHLTQKENAHALAFHLMKVNGEDSKTRQKKWS